MAFHQGHTSRAQVIAVHDVKRDAAAGLGDADARGARLFRVPSGESRMRS